MKLITGQPLTNKSVTAQGLQKEKIINSEIRAKMSQEQDRTIQTKS